MTEISINFMTTEDISEVKAIEKENSLSIWSLEDYEDELGRNESICLVAKSDKYKSTKIAGFIIARAFLSSKTGDTKGNEPGETKVKDPNFIEINNIAIRNRYRRKGIGSQLVDEMILAAKSFEIGEIWLEVRESNDPAIKFYSGLGFSNEYIRKGYYQNPLENAVIMLRKLV